ncbi:unnamed protein product [Effrenium voratum]|nr:unnamed protein product [Effrenium voratum]
MEVAIIWWVDVDDKQTKNSDVLAGYNGVNLQKIKQEQKVATAVDNKDERVDMQKLSTMVRNRAMANKLKLPTQMESLLSDVQGPEQKMQRALNAVRKQQKKRSKLEKAIEDEAEKWAAYQVQIREHLIAQQKLFKERTKALTKAEEAIAKQEMQSIATSSAEVPEEDNEDMHLGGNEDEQEVDAFIWDSLTDKKNKAGREAEEEQKEDNKNISLQEKPGATVLAAAEMHTSMMQDKRVADRKTEAKANFDAWLAKQNMQTMMMRTGEEEDQSESRKQTRARESPYARHKGKGGPISQTQQAVPTIIDDDSDNETQVNEE